MIFNGFSSAPFAAELAFHPKHTLNRKRNVACFVVISCVCFVDVIKDSVVLARNEPQNKSLTPKIQSEGVGTTDDADGHRCKNNKKKICVNQRHLWLKMIAEKGARAYSSIGFVSIRAPI